MYVKGINAFYERVDLGLARSGEEPMALEHREPPDLEVLALFTQSTDREQTPFFVGRIAEIADRKIQLGSIMKRWRSGFPVPDERG